MRQRTAAPASTAVADRWHLLTNLRDAFERLLLGYPGKRKKAARQANETLQLEAIPAEGAHRAPRRRAFKNIIAGLTTLH